MKQNEIEQVVIELCDAVPEFSSNTDSDEVVLRCRGKGVVLIAYHRNLALITQHAKFWAAQQDWMPHMYLKYPTYNVYLFDASSGYIHSVKQTQWFQFDPTVLGSEELQWIRAVTEVAKLITSQGASK